MSRSSRSRKNARKNPQLLELPGECDCPECSGANIDPGQLIDELTTTLAEFDDPLNAEMMGAMFMALGAVVGDEFEQALVDGFVPALEARATDGALAVLLSIGAVAPDQAGKAASAAAERLAEAGVARPGWATELHEAVTVTGCTRLHDTQGTTSVLACTFRRAERSHAFVISVDELDCGAASEIGVLDADQLPEALQELRSKTRETGMEIVAEALDPADLRGHVEKALDARAVHDAGRFDPADLEPYEDSDPYDDDDGPSYPALAALLRARMSTLPAPGKPPAAHADERDAPLAAMQMLAQLLGNTPFGPPPSPRQTRPLPAKRKKADRPAPVYQIKVRLRGSKPPIWRRLEVPADIKLARLHDVIQLAFDWDDAHLHAFSTPYGDFGVADAELGHRAEAPVTLEQVAPGAGSKISYTYDFGDDWEHDITVEKVLDRDAAVTYPRCTGGRRAAPPEDCGGVWGYAELVESLDDPAHPDHEDRLDWLGLDDPADFDPASFDADAVTGALARLR